MKHADYRIHIAIAAADAVHHLFKTGERSPQAEFSAFIAESGSVEAYAASVFRDDDAARVFRERFAVHQSNEGYITQAEWPHRVKAKS